MEEGDAKLAWSRLMKKYEPKTAPSRLMLKRKLTGMVLKSVRDDPDVWLTDLEHVKGQLIAAGSKMTDDELLEHALNSLPKEYELIVAKLEDRLGDKNEPLTIEDLREALNLKYQRMGFGNGGRRQNNAGEGEAAFFAGGFKGKCNSCGGWGHKAKDCKKNGSGNGNNGGNYDMSIGGENGPQCWKCGKVGHVKKMCPENQRNSANVAVESGEDEVGFVSFGGGTEHMCH
eukprot:scaffold4574_cov47-Cylindrotheca_fusiformis.AAC.1